MEIAHQSKKRENRNSIAPDLLSDIKVNQANIMVIICILWENRFDAPEPIVL